MRYILLVTPIMIQNWWSLMFHELVIFKRIFPFFIYAKFSYPCCCLFHVHHPQHTYIIYQIQSTNVLFACMTIQCENGHIACSSCCNKLKNKCPSCFWPIGYNRCRAIEKVLEAVKIPCQNSKYGCKEVVSYSRKSDHEKTCIYAPCSCPLSHCKFIASSKQIYVHFSSKHTNSAIGFKYDSNFSVSLTLTDKFLVLQEQSNGVLFVLNNCVDHRGNVVTINCVGPSSTTGGFSYGLAVKTQGSSLRLESFTKNSQHRVDNPPSTGFLLIPTDFFGSCGQLKLEVYIKRSATCGITSFGIAQGRIGPV